MRNNPFTQKLMQKPRRDTSSVTLENGSRVAVIGGGPAGSFFSYFLLTLAERTRLKIHVDIYEPRDFAAPGPTGCNMCGGVLYESLVESLAVEGINLPETVVRRGVEHNMLHLDMSTVCIQTPRREKRIATTFRGIGPRGLMNFNSEGLDSFLLKLAEQKGARHIRRRVESVRRSATSNSNDLKKEGMQVKTPGGQFETYDLVAVTTGVNTAVLKLFSEMDFGYQPPRTAKLAVREYYLGKGEVSECLESAFHAFLLDIPGLDYGAIIPKGDYVTVCLLSSHGDLQPHTMDTFLNHPAVKSLLPPDFPVEHFACGCGPRINIMGSTQPFGDRIVFIGDCGVSRLYKDGLGGAYRAAKAAARTAIFQGVSANDFKLYYLPFCQKTENDNRIGQWLFMVIGQINKIRFARRAIFHMVSSEQEGKASAESGMSMVIWDMLTGGAPYRDVLLRTLSPVFMIRFLWSMLVSLFARDEGYQTAEATSTCHPTNYVVADPRPADNSPRMENMIMRPNALGKVYQDGEVIFRKDDAGDCMFVIQEGQIEVVGEFKGQQIRLGVCEPGDLIGEMAIFEHQVHSATVRALGKARVLTVDEKTFLRYVHQDPSLAYQLLKMMSNRIRRLDTEIGHLKLNQRLAEKDAQVPVLARMS